MPEQTNYETRIAITGNIDQRLSGDIKKLVGLVLGRFVGSARLTLRRLGVLLPGICAVHAGRRRRSRGNGT
jgi:hypothetical protein